MCMVGLRSQPIDRAAKALEVGSLLEKAAPRCAICHADGEQGRLAHGHANVRDAAGHVLTPLPKPCAVPTQLPTAQYRRKCLARAAFRVSLAFHLPRSR